MKKFAIVVMTLALLASVAVAKDKINAVEGTRGELDCTNAVPITCGEAVTGTTVGLPNNVTYYSCVGWEESGGEMVYELVLDDAYVVNATLSGMAYDLDVFILDGCEEANCVGYGGTLATTTIGPGTYYIVVDGYNGAEDIFSLYVECDLVQDPADPLAGGDTCDEAVDFMAAGVTRWSTDLADYTDVYDGGGCFWWHLPAGDAVYKVDLEAGQNFRATLDGPCDFAMYVFADCNADAIVCADDGGSGGQEVVDFDAPATGTYYLVLDAFQSAGCEVICEVNEMPVAVETADWSSVKAMFR